MNNLGGVTQYQNPNTLSGNVSGAIGAGKDAAMVSNNLRDQLTPGKVFEGTITEMKDGVVTIGLDNGKTISARLDAGVNLRPGEPMLFEVKTNNGTQIEIRPVALESASNPTLLNALTAAGVTTNAKNLSLVNMMMQLQLPVDKKSLLQMMRTMSTFQNTEVETLLQMKKLGLPISKESIIQFENYKNNRHSLVQQLDGVIDKLPQLLSREGGDPKQLLALSNQLLAVFENSSATNLSTVKYAGSEGMVSQNPAQAAGQTAPTAQAAGLTAPTAQTGAVPFLGEPLAAAEGANKNQSTIPTQPPGSPAPDSPLAKTDIQSALPLTETKIPDQQLALEQQLRSLPGMEENPVIFKDGKLNPLLTPEELLRAIQDTLQKAVDSQQLTGTKLNDFLSGTEFKSLLKQVMEQQWTLKPNEVAAKENIEQLYERVRNQLDNLETVLQNVGKDAAATKDVANAKSNLDFMNQVNQLYTYIQIPLKLQHQNANSELFVYTNKKNLKDREGELSALLHLDLDDLGATDIHIKLNKNNVTANFFLTNDFAVQLLQSNMDDLTQRLENKGYQCSVSFEKRQQDKTVDFVEDFLEREKPTGTLHRYSFDVMA